MLAGCLKARPQLLLITLAQEEVDLIARLQDRIAMRDEYDTLATN